jgi:hypothetical protein
MFIFCVEPLKIGDEIASVWITVLDQRLFIRIETLCGCSSTEIYELLQGVFGAS